MATLKVPSNVPALADDCDNLRKAFQGWGTNEALIISILGHRDAAQRRAIRKHYADTYGEELLRSITDEISGDFERAVILWTLDPAERDAVLANETAKKWHPGNPVLVEIACARGSKQLFAARQAYHDRFKRSLEEDVAAHVTGDFRKDLKADPKDEFLKTLRAVIRCFTCPDRYFEKVARLAIAGNGTDENSLTRVITTRAEVDLKLIKEAYQKRNSVPLEKAVAGDTSGDYESMLLALLGKE
ncbi:hypothetical protein CFC21_108225 [Triticum aestivum]|uniref:Annexin n=2 Tax=Triticum aestivum TaxID=4565 RepID=A0A3B6TND9_WHEAT|nr:hypothetical protein CFC21_108225 [Triticum aestivum]